jgi:predicted ATPase
VEATVTQPCSDASPFARVYRPLPPHVLGAEWGRVRPALREAISEAVREARWPIYMYGMQGCGKSCAMACCYRSYRGERHAAQWILLDPFIQTILRCRREGQVEVPGLSVSETVFRTESQWFKIVANAAVLCVDDVGIRSPTDSAYEVLFKLINAREGRPSFYTSNHSPSDLLAIYRKRILSRMTRGTVIHCTGEDQRMRTRKDVTA